MIGYENRTTVYNFVIGETLHLNKCRPTSYVFSIKVYIDDVYVEYKTNGIVDRKGKRCFDDVL